MGAFETAKVNSDKDSFAVLYSRVLHLLGRYERLKRHATHLNTPDFIVQAEELLEKIAAERPHNISETSATGFAGFAENETLVAPANIRVDGGVLREFEERAAALSTVSESQSSNTAAEPAIPGLSIRTITNINQASRSALPEAPVWPPEQPAMPVTNFEQRPYSSASGCIPKNTARNHITAAAIATLASARPNAAHDREPIRPVIHDRYVDEPNYPNRFFQPPVAIPLNNNAPRVGLSQIISRWTVRFGGNKKDLPIDEFLFRVENLAAADMVPLNNLVGGLHHLLFDNASDFYWILRRKYPGATWLQVKNSLKAHFGKQENDFEIRNVIMNRKQGMREEFGEFSLAVECLAARLTRPMYEGDLVDILRENMSSRLRDRLLMVPIDSIDHLKAYCKRYERLWATTTDRSRDNRFNLRVAEVELPMDEPAINLSGGSNGGLNQLAIMSSETNRPQMEPLELSAINRDLPTVRRSDEYAICWNCRDIGHTYVDCTANERRIFCFGCGENGVIKPRCAKCNPGNAGTGGNPSGRSRPNPFAVNRARPNANSNQ